MVALRLQIQLEHVNHLMTQCVTEFGKAASEGESDTPLEEVSRTEEPFGRGEREDVSLLEISVRGVDDQRDTRGNIMPELNGQRIVARFRISEGGGGELSLGGIVVEVDMRPPNNPPVELPILNLVLAEREELGVCRGGEDGQDGEDGEAPQSVRPLATPGSFFAVDRPHFHSACPLHLLRLVGHRLIVRIRSPWVIRDSAPTLP